MHIKFLTCICIEHIYRALISHDKLHGFSNSLRKSSVSCN